MKISYIQSIYAHKRKKMQNFRFLSGILWKSFKKITEYESEKIDLFLLFKYNRYRKIEKKFFINVKANQRGEYGERKFRDCSNSI